MIDLGEGQAVAFKVESHNHPSAVEPFQGAATGVGGIIRDIVAMGARPIAILDGLRFGEPDWHFERAVSGISHYGNCIGIANVGGEVVFDEAYRDNCLVNAMCVGLLPTERVLSARASGVGNPIVLFGASTGRDGIGGASVLASQDLEGSEEKRPSVQIGDPFTGKKLVEVSTELVERGLVASLQDCGAAGLASSLAEMARGGVGVDVHLDQVSLREPDLEPWEIMVSESQERMVAVVLPEHLAEAQELFDRWEVHHAVIGDVTDRGQLRALYGGEVVGEVPAELLTDACPRYELEFRARESQPHASVPVSAPSTRDALLELLASRNVRSRAWVYRRYDHLVGSRTVRRPGLDAAVLRLRPSFRGLAVSLDGPSRVAALDPRAAGVTAVLEAARNVACVGGEPLAITDCLNFGNPEKPERAWELAEAIDGMADACRALGIPIVSGNVSLYNETEGRPIHPTPVVGCVGLVPDVRGVPGRWREGDAILLASAGDVRIDGSEYQGLYDTVHGRPPEVDLAAEAALLSLLWQTAPRLSLAHDVARGGLAVCLAQAALWSGAGAELDVPDEPVTLFGECGGQVVVACDPAVADSLRWPQIGTVSGNSILGATLEELAEAYT